MKMGTVTGCSSLKRCEINIFFRATQGSATNISCQFIVQCTEAFSKKGLILFKFSDSIGIGLNWECATQVLKCGH